MHQSWIWAHSDRMTKLNLMQAAAKIYSFWNKEDFGFWNMCSEKITSEILIIIFLGHKKLQLAEPSYITLRHECDRTLLLVTQMLRHFIYCREK